MVNENSINNNLAIVSVIIATLCMALQDAIVKLASNDLTLWQLFVLRGCIALVMLVVILFFSKNKDTIWPKNILWSTIRSCLLFLMYIAFYFGIYFVDLSIAAGLYYTGPIFIVFFSWMMLKEKINYLNIASVFLGFIGVMVIILPEGGDISFTLLLPILAAVFYALAMVTTKGKCQNESLASLVVSLNVVFVVLGGLASTVIYSLNLSTNTFSQAPFLLANWVGVSDKEWIVLFILAGINVIIHFLLAKAYKIGAPSVVAAFDYSYLIFAVFWGWLLLSEVQEVNTIIGICIIMLSGLTPLLYKDFSLRRS